MINFIFTLSFSISILLLFSSGSPFSTTCRLVPMMAPWGEQQKRAEDNGAKLA